MKLKRLAFYCSVYQSAAGFGALLAGEEGVVLHRLPFGEKSASAARQAVAALYPLADEESTLSRTGAGLLARYFDGEQVRFDLPLELSGYTDFQREVYRTVAGIPFGTVMTYGEVAAACGSPRGARAIGGAMAKNRLPILIPCHRVVGGSGTLTGFTAPGGVVSKRELLLMEGVPFQGDGGRVLRLTAGL